MRRRNGILLATGSAVAVVAAVVAVSIVWPGLDAKQTPPVDSSVWALQTDEGRRYARVNTAIGELDTVRNVSNPSAVAQSDSGAYLFSESFGKVTKIDEAMPADLDEDTLRESPSTPTGTVDVAVSGDFVAYRTDSGAVFVGTLSSGGASQIDPYGTGEPDDDTPEYTADAIGVDDAGVLYSYSASDGAVLRYAIADSEVQGRDEIASPPETDAAELTAAGGTWFLVDTLTGRIWKRGAEAPLEVTLSGAVAIGRATAAGDAAYIADATGLVRVPVDDSDPERIVGGDADRDFGTPARPVVVDGEVYAGWLSADGGVLWRTGSGEVALSFANQTLGDERRPVFVTSGSTMILNETRSGWVWTVPDGQLVASSQDWSLDDRTDPESEPSDEQAAVVIDPKPPIAEDDAFGVRAGSLVSLSVLLNDHDPNEDVLSVDPSSVTGLDPAFGSVSITDNGQSLAVRVAPGAAGTATVRYRVTDGTSADGLYSEPATVTLSVVDDDANDAPAWCGTEGCLQEWPTPEVEPGGTVSVPILPGWVDPEGDPLLLLSVENTSGIGAVAATPGGDVVYQHPDPSDTTARTVEIAVTVSDTRGAVSTKALKIQVSPQAQLTAQSFAVLDTADAGVTVDVAPHVTGTAGRISLTAVRVLDDAAAEAVPMVGGTSFDFSARTPGSYRVSYTVGTDDGSTEATAIARITILPEDAAAQLATAPVIAFVRPKEDVTLDVFAAVSNPTHRVLLLSDVQPVADQGASMTVDVVGQSYLRVTGTTESGAPGRLGTVRYTVSDGTQDAGSRIEGEATVYLLPLAPQLAPIAVDDTVVVRAGAQLDIPVLANDVAPSGGAITLNPASVVSSMPDALAFGSGDVVRYLAPDEPGEYTIEYAIFSTGAPGLADTATVRVTVISDESNRNPRPETLEGRVLAGQSTTIAFEQFGVDPDGDAVRLDRIISQPEVGSAAISADGASIVYTSVPDQSGGQVSFEYRVVDGSGATGTGTARIGVLDGEANPSPVTFTDYVQVQAGSGNAVRLNPTANDIDPTGGRLAVTSVRPDVPETLEDGEANPQYAALDELIAGSSGDTVRIRAGTSAGTMSFLYDVVSDSGNTARGLIVVKVVRESVPDYPIVADTALTAQTREDFPDGVDVVSGKVTWTGGDTDDLTLSLWGSPRGLEVDGWTISGELPARTRIIPFAVTGPADGGTEEVTSYGFLRVPGEDDLALALRPGVTARSVEEGESTTFDMADLVAAPRRAEIEIGDDVAASGARDAAECTTDGDTGIRYDAGMGAPWADACIVPVRLAGQSDWSYLSVPIRILALEPQPELSPASLTIAPGQSVGFELSQMTRWQGPADWEDIEYALSYSGAFFDVSERDGVVTISGRDQSMPGSEEAATVSVTSHPGVTPVRLILRVGAAPSTLPQGGTLAQQCSQAAGASCTFRVVAAAGEVNPLPRTPLRLDGVRATGECEGVEFEQVSRDSVRASWTEDAPGATCTASFSVIDAQGRRTNGDRDGTILFDLQGFPRAPAAIVQTQYGDRTLTLRVDPGEARQAYPALTGFAVRSGAQIVATCSPEGVCPAISAPNGEERVYTAVAVNDVGESAESVRTSGWAYEVPGTPSAVVAAPIVTGGEGNLVSLRIEGIDVAGTAYLEIASPSGEAVQVGVRGDSTVLVPRYNIGTNAQSPLTVTPHSRFAIPPGLSGSTSGAAFTTTANGIGAPLDPQLRLSSSSNGDGTSTITATGGAQLNGSGAQLRYGFVLGSGGCAVSTDGNSTTFPPQADGVEYTVTMCVESWYADASYGRTQTSGTVRAAQNGRAPQGWTFVVDPAPSVDEGNQVARWSIRQTPSSPENPPRNNEVQFQNGPTTSVYGRDPEMFVRYTHRFWGTSTDWSRVVPASGSAPYQVQANWQLVSCVGGADLQVTGGSSNAPNGAQAAVGFDPSGLVFRDENGAVLPQTTPGTWTVPTGATSVEGIRVSVDWSPLGWNLAPASATFGGQCDPNIPPEEPPAPAP